MEGVLLLFAHQTLGSPFVRSKLTLVHHVSQDTGEILLEAKEEEMQEFYEECMRRFCKTLNAPPFLPKKMLRLLIERIETESGNGVCFDSFPSSMIVFSNRSIDRHREFYRKMCASSSLLVPDELKGLHGMKERKGEEVAFLTRHHDLVVSSLRRAHLVVKARRKKEEANGFVIESLPTESLEVRRHTTDVKHRSEVMHRWKLAFLSERPSPRIVEVLDTVEDAAGLETASFVAKLEDERIVRIEGMPLSIFGIDGEWLNTYKSHRTLFLETQQEIIEAKRAKKANSE